MTRRQDGKQMTQRSDNSGFVSLADEVATTKNQNAALFAHLTRSAQMQLGVNEQLRRDLADATALHANHQRRITSLERDLAVAQSENKRQEAIAQRKDDKIIALGTALDLAQRHVERLDLLVAAMRGDRVWRMGAAWRYLGRLAARIFCNRASRRVLGAHFDAEWFTDQNLEVKMLGIDPFRYFMLYGVKRDLDPNPCFAMRWYSRCYSDVSSRKIHPLIHFANYGIAEGRKPHPDYSCAAYRTGLQAQWRLLEPVGREHRDTPDAVAARDSA